MSDAKDYQLAIAPTWLLGPWGEALMLALGLAKDATIEGAREAAVQRFVRYCAADALDEHGEERQILRAPAELLEQYRARLILAWDAWERAGTPGGILAQLVPVGIEHAEVLEGVSADPSIPSSWAKWYLRVHEPHPFTPPIVYGDGREYGDGALYGFGNDFAIAYTRAVVRKWNAAHAHCTGIVIEFSDPAIDVRLPV
jgi:hypothetical protein